MEEYRDADFVFVCLLAVLEIISCVF